MKGTINEAEIEKLFAKDIELIMPKVMEAKKESVKIFQASSGIKALQIIQISTAMQKHSLKFKKEFLDLKNQAELELDEEKKTNIQQTAQAKLILALAYKKAAEKTKEEQEVVKGFTFTAEDYIDDFLRN